MQKKNLCYKSDFKITEKCDAGYAMRFRFLYYVGTPAKAYVACFDGSIYSNCQLNGDGTLTVCFDDHGLGIGDLMVERRYYLTDEQFQSGVCDIVVPGSPVVVIDKDVPQDSKLFQLCLSPKGLSYIECESIVEPYWMLGGFGEAAYKNEELRKQQEAARVLAEQKRANAWSEFFGAAQSAWDSWFPDTKNTVKSWYDETTEAVSSWFSSTKTEVSGWFNTTKNDVATWFSTTKNNFTEWFSKAKNDYSVWFADTSGDYTKWITQAKSDWSEWYSDVTTNWAARLTAMTNEWTNKMKSVSDQWTSRLEAINNEWSESLAAINNAWDNRLTAINTEWSEWFTDTKSAWKSWYDENTQAWATWHNETAQAWTTWFDARISEWATLKRDATDATTAANNAAASANTATENANEATAAANQAKTDCKAATAAANQAKTDCDAAAETAIKAADTAKNEAQAAKAIATEASNINNQSKVLISEMNDGLEAQKTATTNAETAAASAQAAAELASKAGTSIMIRPTGMSVDVPKVVPVGATAMVEVSMVPDSCYASKVFQSKRGCFVAPDGSAEFTEIGTAVFYVVPTLNDTIAKKVEVTVRALESLQAEDGTEITMEDGSTFEI